MKLVYSLLIAQLLLTSAGSRLKLKSVHSAGDDYYRFRVMGRRGISPKIVMPVIHRGDGVEVMSLLGETAGKRHTWLFNGQASVGFNQITHYGGSGLVRYQKSKADIMETFGYQPNDPSMSKPVQQILEAAGEGRVLVLYDLEGNAIKYDMPSEHEASALCRALDGLPIFVDTEIDRYKALVKTFGLALDFGTGEHAGLMQSKEAIKAAKAA